MDSSCIYVVRKIIVNHPPVPADARANRTPSAADSAYAATKASILDGDVPSGSMLSEGDVATRLGMSRTPVREAFLRLQSEGWLRLFPKRGALVLAPEPGEAREVLEARLLVEGAGATAAVASEQSAGHVAAAMRSCLQAQRTAHASEDLAAFAEHDLAFHSAIVDAAHNRILADFQARLADRERLMSTRSLWRRQESSELVLAQHEGLIEAIAARNAPLFQERLREHLTTVHSRLLEG